MAKLSNSSSAPTHRKSYLLSVTPVEYSLTEGTNIPAPNHTPPQSPTTEIARPPTPGRGPLNSHPATPDDSSDMNLDAPPAAAPPPPSLQQKENGFPAAARMMSSDGADSFRTPTSPASATPHTPQSQARRKPSGVRKLLSLSNLRSSFSSSRTSLAQHPRLSHDTTTTHQSSMTTTHHPNLKRRPSSPPSLLSTTASPPQAAPLPPPPRLRTKKSASDWFRRKSGIFALNDDGDYLDPVVEDQHHHHHHHHQPPDRPDTRESKRVKPSLEPPPRIPEIGRGGFSGGDLGWDEGAFRR